MTAKTAKVSPIYESDAFGMAATSSPMEKLGTVRCRIAVPFRDSGGRESTRMMLAQTNHCENIETAATIARNIRTHNPQYHVAVRFTVEL